MGCGVDKKRTVYNNWNFNIDWSTLKTEGNVKHLAECAAGLGLNQLLTDSTRVTILPQTIIERL